MCRCISPFASGRLHSHAASTELTSRSTARLSPERASSSAASPVPKAAQKYWLGLSGLSPGAKLKLG